MDLIEHEVVWNGSHQDCDADLFRKPEGRRPTPQQIQRAKALEAARCRAYGRQREQLEYVFGLVTAEAQTITELTKCSGLTRDVMKGALRTLNLQGRILLSGGIGQRSKHNPIRYRLAQAKVSS